VLFDFDGTLTRPGEIDFAAVHRAVRCPREVGLLEFLGSIEDPGERRRKEEVLIVAEMEAAERCRANEGARELVAFLRAKGIPMAIITRNRREAVERSLAKIEDIHVEDFAVVVTRDVSLSPKPFPDGVLYVARELGVAPRDLLVVGDHSFDIEAGRRAGAITMYLRNGAQGSAPLEGDFVVSSLEEAGHIIRYGLPLPSGKLPADLLKESLGGIGPGDPAVIIGASVGEDAAAVDIAESEVLVLASDPITLTADSMARYMVLTNANDVAALGATPRWLLSTLLFPVGSSASEVMHTIREIQEACSLYGLSLCGGHTEVTEAVSRPVLMGTVAGTARASELIDKRRMKQGDRILMTKGVAVEGTALIAREFGGRLMKAGIPPAEVAECARMLEDVGVLEEARIARSFAGVSALHDVTEGGLATAVRELGAAGGHRLRIHMDRIPVYRRTERACDALGLDPLGLIGSGSLLIICSPDESSSLAAAVASAGVTIVDIGEVAELGEGIEAFREGILVEWPSFERDEVSRIIR